jgi:hypothetical protein
MKLKKYIILFKFREEDVWTFFRPFMYYDTIQEAENIILKAPAGFIYNILLFDLEID